MGLAWGGALERGWWGWQPLSPGPLPQGDLCVTQARVPRRPHVYFPGEAKNGGVGGRRGWLRAWEGFRAFDPHPNPLPAREREDDGGSSKGLTPRTLRPRRRRPLPQASQEATSRRTGVMQRSPQGRVKERRPELSDGGLARCCAWAVTSGRPLPASSATGRGRKSRRTLVCEGRFARVSLGD